MKRLALVVLAFVGPLILGACQEKLEWEIEFDVVVGNTESMEDGETVAYEEVMPLPGHLTPHQQGGDCWGDYFFQFASNNSEIRIYNLASKSLVQAITLPTRQRGFVSNCHCNTVCFGTEFYHEDDQFPLIYVSTGYASNGYTGALVYRITQQNEIFNLTLVQTIRFPVDESSWTEFVPGENGIAYLCYSSENVIFKVRMPSLKEGNVIIERTSAIDTLQCKPQPDWMSTSRNQDRLYYQDKILFVSGVPPEEASVFFALNLETKERERIINFIKIGLENEPESIFIWRGDICVAFVDKIVKLYL